MPYSHFANDQQLPDDPKVFESAIKETIRQMADDGSLYVTPRDVCQYNNWIYSLSTAAQISYMLRERCHLQKATRKSYRLKVKKVIRA